jgi:hypothetical protein
VDETLIETQARYLIKDSVHPTHAKQSTRQRRWHRRLCKLSWLHCQCSTEWWPKRLLHTPRVQRPMPRHGGRVDVAVTPMEGGVL